MGSVCVPFLSLNHLHHIWDSSCFMMYDKKMESKTSSMTCTIYTLRWVILAIYRMFMYNSYSDDLFLFIILCSFPVCNESFLWNQCSNPVDGIWQKSAVPWKEAPLELMNQPEFCTFFYFLHCVYHTHHWSTITCWLCFDKFTMYYFLYSYQPQYKR